MTNVSLSKARDQFVNDVHQIKKKYESSNSIIGQIRDLISVLLGGSTSAYAYASTRLVLNTLYNMQVGEIVTVKNTIGNVKFRIMRQKEDVFEIGMTYRGKNDGEIKGCMSLEEFEILMKENNVIIEPRHQNQTPVQSIIVSHHDVTVKSEGNGPSTENEPKVNNPYTVVNIAANGMCAMMALFSVLNSNGKMETISDFHIKGVLQKHRDAIINSVQNTAIRVFGPGGDDTNVDVLFPTSVRPGNGFSKSGHFLQKLYPLSDKNRAGRFVDNIINNPKLFPQNGQDFVFLLTNDRYVPQGWEPILQSWLETFGEELYPALNVETRMSPPHPNEILHKPVICFQRGHTQVFLPGQQVVSKNNETINTPLEYNPQAKYISPKNMYKKNHVIKNGILDYIRSFIELFPGTDEKSIIEYDIQFTPWFTKEGAGKALAKMLKDPSGVVSKALNKLETSETITKQEASMLFEFLKQADTLFREERDPRYSFAEHVMYNNKVELMTISDQEVVVCKALKTAANQVRLFGSGDEEWEFNPDGRFDIGRNWTRYLFESVLRILATTEKLAVGNPKIRTAYEINISDETKGIEYTLYSGDIRRNKTDGAKFTMFYIPVDDGSYNDFYIPPKNEL